MSAIPHVRGKMLCIPNAAVTIVRGPRRCESGSARLQSPRHPNGRGKWKKMTGKLSEDAGRLAVTAAL
jgi:hypothetical protein